MKSLFADIPFLPVIFWVAANLVTVRREDGRTSSLEWFSQKPLFLPHQKLPSHLSCFSTGISKAKQNHGNTDRWLFYTWYRCVEQCFMAARKSENSEMSVFRRATYILQLKLVGFCPQRRYSFTLSLGVIKHCWPKRALFGPSTTALQCQFFPPTDSCFLSFPALRKSSMAMQPVLPWNTWNVLLFFFLFFLALSWKPGGTCQV